MIINSGSNDNRVYINSQYVSAVTENEDQTVSICLINGTTVKFVASFDDVLQKMDKDFKNMAMLLLTDQPGHRKH